MMSSTLRSNFLNIITTEKIIHHTTDHNKNFPLKKGTLRIGTSNITLPGNKQTFPKEFSDKSRLNYYASLFNSLEVNSSFYKVPLPATFAKWAADVPHDFQFTVKLWKEITHDKTLTIDPEKVNYFLNAASGLADNKGCLLIQFPGKINFEHFAKVEELLSEIKNAEGGTIWRKAIEFRSPTWYVSETEELMDEYDASMVLHDMPKSKLAEPNKNAPFVFIRYHGPAGDYRGSYSDEFLLKQYQNMKGWLRKGKDVYVYFNNTIGNAFENAMTLKKFSKEK
jgi:uncharacterized protein YecE (DUF72 family)